MAEEAWQTKMVRDLDRTPLHRLRVATGPHRAAERLHRTTEMGQNCEADPAAS